MTSHAVSVIIPVRSDPGVFQAIDSVIRCADEVAQLQVVVVDNASTPEFTAELRRRLPGMVTLLSLADVGVYAARNRGIDAADGEVVFFTDADCIVLKGWLAAGLGGIASGADIVQGYSGSVVDSPVAALIQRRYEAHLRRLQPGQPTECDTRNLAVRRRVFEALRFEERYRRVGDTAFGLRAEAAGIRVAYQPLMRVDHLHDDDLRVFAAKQVCHGWGAQRLMQEHPQVEWHGGHLKAVSRLSKRFAPRAGTGLLAAACSRGAVLNAGLLQRCAGRLPGSLGFWWLTAVDKLAALGGHLSYRPGRPEPSPSGILGRQLPRD
ncbi:MAG: glycosyltransferase [Dehalococcoidia bacterium]|nr:glycosyltransferase [Dehalococcoidia bacterium]